MLGGISGRKYPAKPSRPRFVYEAAGVPTKVSSAALLAREGTEPNRQRVRSVDEPHTPPQPQSITQPSPDYGCSQSRG